MLVVKWKRACRAIVVLDGFFLASLMAFAFALPRASHAEPGEQKAAKKSEQKRTIDPKAMAELARSVAYLRSLPAFSVRAQVMRDEVVRDNYKLQRNSSARVEVRRPDRLRAELAGDEGRRLFNYDGRTLAVYVRDQNYYGSVEAPETVLALLDEAMNKHTIELPLLDVIYVAMGGELSEQVREAGEIGPSVIDGTPCTQLAFRGEHVDWQLWIEHGSRPVPRKLVITTTDSPTLPQFAALMQWNVMPEPSDASFAFSPPEGAMRMALTSVQQASQPPRSQRKEAR